MKNIFIELKKLLSEPGRWTQNAIARDAQGKQVLANSEEAGSYCLVGGLQKVCHDLGLSEVEYWQGRLCLMAHLGQNVEVWNDSLFRKHEQVLAALDKVEASL